MNWNAGQPMVGRDWDQGLALPHCHTLAHSSEEFENLNLNVHVVIKVYLSR